MGQNHPKFFLSHFIKLSHILANYTKGQVAKLIRTILKKSLELTYRIWITLYFVLMISSECKNSRWSINEIHNNFYWWSVETFFILQWIKRTWRHVEIDVCVCQFFPLSTEKSIFVTHWHMALKIRKICVKKAG